MGSLGLMHLMRVPSAWPLKPLCSAVPAPRAMTVKPMYTNCAGCIAALEALGGTLEYIKLLETDLASAQNR